MYFCYVDESGDAGAHDPQNPDSSGSAYFILTGMVIAANQWKMSLDILKKFRKELVADALLKYDQEFHCSELVDNHSENYNSLTQEQRWEMVGRMAASIGQRLDASIIAVVIDKTQSGLAPGEYLTTAITALYSAFEEFIIPDKANGIVLFDRANERQATTHIRRLMQTGDTGNPIAGVKINRIVEDPFFRLSNDSMFIQAADTIAFSLKHCEFPIGSKKKLGANRIFGKYLRERCFISAHAGEDGIIRI